MSKKILLHVDAGDYFQVLLTDTVTVDVPIIFSNVGFYHQVKRHFARPVDTVDEFAKDLVQRRLRVGGHTIPKRFVIGEALGKERQVAVMHPASQMAVVEFYREYSGLMEHFCSRSNWSLRAPSGRAKYFFVPNPRQEERRYRLSSSSVDLEDDESRFRHPVTFFKYRGVSRLHEFLDSTALAELEKKYSYLLQLDVSDCFGSIYTHSIAWATKTKSFIKDQARGRDNTFGGRFDRLMQQANYNETNGILVGPEVSRIFAEVILQDVDLAVEEKSRKKGLLVGKHYEVRRYVDDFFVFAKNEDAANQVERLLAEGLREYNLTINKAKCLRLQRPFLTPRSAAVSKLGPLLLALGDRLFTEELSRVIVSSATELCSNYAPPAMPFALVGVAISASVGSGHSGYPCSEGPHCEAGAVVAVDFCLRKGRYRFLKPKSFDAFSERSLRQHISTFLRDVRSAVAPLDSGYDLVALYVIGWADNRLKLLCSAPETSEPGLQDRDYAIVFRVLLEVVFFLFRVHPTTGASLKAPNASLLVGRFCAQMDLGGARHICDEFIYEEASSFIEGRLSQIPSQENPDIPTLNMVSVLSQVDRTVPDDIFRRWLDGCAPAGYFSLVVFLHHAIAKRSELRGSGVLQDIEALVEKRIDQELARGAPSKQAEIEFLLFDTIACQYLSENVRKKALQALCLGTKWPPPAVALSKVLKVFEGNPWFVNWKEIDLFRHLERKEAHLVY